MSAVMGSRSLQLGCNSSRGCPLSATHPDETPDNLPDERGQDPGALEAYNVHHNLSKTNCKARCESMNSTKTLEARRRRLACATAYLRGRNQPIPWCIHRAGLSHGIGHRARSSSPWVCYLPQQGKSFEGALHNVCHHRYCKAQAVWRPANGDFRWLHSLVYLQNPGTPRTAAGQKSTKSSRLGWTKVSTTSVCP